MLVKVGLILVGLAVMAATRSLLARLTAVPEEPASGESFAIEHERMWAKIWPRVPIVLGAVGSAVLLVGLIAGG